MKKKENYSFDNNKCIVADSQKEKVLFFCDTIKEYLKLMIIYNKNPNLDCLNKDLCNRLFEADNDYDHNHRYNTEIKYEVNTNFDLMIKITDLSSQWKAFNSETPIYFTIMPSNNFEVYSNSATKIYDTPSIVLNLITNTYFESFLSNIDKYQELFQKEIDRIKNIICLKEFNTI